MEENKQTKYTLEDWKKLWLDIAKEKDKDKIIGLIMMAGDIQNDLIKSNISKGERINSMPHGEVIRDEIITSEGNTYSIQKGQYVTNWVGKIIIPIMNGEPYEGWADIEIAIAQEVRAKMNERRCLKNG